jgi:plasmid stabilization system protein ParE
MKYKIVILPRAKEDLREAAKWYNNAQKGHGKELVKQIRKRISELENNPLSCQIRYSEVHTALVKNFPYMLHYYVDQVKRSIVIISILHTSRDPKMWDERSKE